METETKGYFLIILGLLIFIISIGIFFVSTRTQSLDSSKILESCNTIQYNGPGKINTLFFAEKEQAEKYVDFFLEAEPFIKNQDSFNFFYIDDYEPECERYKNIAVLCHSKQLIEKAASCPGVDFIVVLQEEENQIRSSAYLNVMSLNSKHVLYVFLHEFGHAFGNLAEEYVNNQNPQRGSENCQATCEKFDGNIDGCYDGCSKTTFKRSVKEGVMRTLSPQDKKNPFGLFNSNIIQEVISSRVRGDTVLTGEATNEILICKEEKYLLYNDGEISVNSGCVGTNGNGASKYLIKEGDEVILEEKFNTLIWTDAQSTNTLFGETYDGKERPLLLTLPITAEADTLEIYDSRGNLIDELNIKGAGARPCSI